MSRAQKLSTDAEEILHQDGCEALQVGSELKRRIWRSQCRVGWWETWTYSASCSLNLTNTKAERWPWAEMPCS